MPSVVVAGASGVVGNAVLERFLEHSGWDVIALSRRRPEIDSTRPYRHLSVDLRDADAARAALSGLTEVTHLVYAALFEKPGLIAGWQERDQMETNLAMLQNTLGPLQERSPLRHVTLLQGTKAYGIHLHPMPVPARERAPRDDHENFYWLQEDHLREQAADRGYGWTVLRPQLIVGRSWGVAMNLAPVIGAYAAIRREEGKPFSFPGGPSYVWEAVDARLLADVIHWAGTSPLAVNEHFNVTNGDVFTWRDLWPGMAEVLGVEVGPDEPFSMAAYLEDKEDVWRAIVAREGLRDVALRDLLGESHHYADFCMAHGADAPPPPAFTSRIKLQQAGFGGCQDTAEMFRFWLQDLIGRRLLPRF